MSYSDFLQDQLKTSYYEGGTRTVQFSINEVVYGTYEVFLTPINDCVACEYASQLFLEDIKKTGLPKPYANEYRYSAHCIR